MILALETGPDFKLGQTYQMICLNQDSLHIPVGYNTTGDHVHDVDVIVIIPQLDQSEQLIDTNDDSWTHIKLLCHVTWRSCTSITFTMSI